MGQPTVLLRETICLTNSNNAVASCNKPCMQRCAPSRFESHKSIQFSFPKSLFFVVFLISLFLFMLRSCSSLVVLFSSLVAGKVCSSQDSVLVHKKEQAKIKYHDAAHRPHQALPNPPIRLTDCVPSHEVRSSNVDLSSGYHIPRALCRGTVHVNRGNCSPQMQTEGNAYA